MRVGADRAILGGVLSIKTGGFSGDTSIGVSIVFSNQRILIGIADITSGFIAVYFIGHRIIDSGDTGIGISIVFSD